APVPVVARERLMARDWPAVDVAPLIVLIAEPGRAVAEDGTYRLSETQARAILDLRLQRLTGLERDKIAEELTEVAKLIEGYLELLADRDKLFALMRKELLEIKQQFATPRRTEILDNEFEQDIEDLIQREDIVVTVTHGGFVNRVPLSEGETITTVMPMPEDEASWATLNVMFATASGGVRRNELSDFVNVNQTGKIAMKFEGDDAGDRLIGVAVCAEDQDVLLATRLGRSMRFPVSTVRVFQSRASTGVRGIALADGDEVISMSLV